MTPLHQTLIQMLPYGLKLSGDQVKIWTLSPYVCGYDFANNLIGINYVIDQSNFTHTPILRRLSDLDKEQIKEMFCDLHDHPFERIEVGEDFRSRSNRRIYNIMGNGQLIEKIIIHIPSMRYDQVEWLASRFFNIFNVSQGQFIPVTKEFNPY